MSLHPCEACGAPAPAGRHADPAECIATLTRERNEAVEYAVNRVAACWKLEKQRDEALAHVETLREALAVAEKIMHDANGALESDATVDDRRAVFERVQDYFDPRERSGFGDVLASTPARSLAAVKARVAERFLKWAEFGAWAFESFWQDGEPGDLEGGDLQERAMALGLLGRTAEHDAGATHAEDCEWQPGMPAEDCDCCIPLAAPFDSAAIRSEFGIGGTK